MKKRNKKKEKEMTFKRTWQNMFFALRIVWSCSPMRVIYTISTTVIGRILGFFAGTWMTRYIFNSIQNQVPFAEVIAVVCAIYLADVTFVIFEQLFNRLALPILRNKITRKLNNMLFRKVADVDLSCYEDTEFYKKFTMTIPEAMGGVEEYAMSLINMMLGTIIGIITNTAIVLIIDPILLLLAFIPFISNLLFGKGANKIQYDYQMQLTDIRRDKEYVDRVFYLSDYAKEMRMSNINVVMMKRFYEDLKQTQKATGKWGWKTARFLFLKGLLVGTFVYYGGLFYAAYRLLVSQTMLIGDCIVISGAITTVSQCIGAITSTYMKMNQHAMFLENLRGFMEYKPKIKSLEGAHVPDRTKAVICFDNVTFRYDNTETDVLKNISFSINTGEKIAIVGANGAGKSTLVKLMMRLYDVTEGQVCCSGENIKTLDLEEYRRLYGVIFQDYKIFAMSVRDNVLLGAEGDDNTVIEALKSAGVYDKVMTLPDGIDTMLTREYHEDGAVLSGGEYQKICIARVFARNAPIVILDEPSSALDPVAEYQMYENMLRACKGRSVVFISHRLSSAVLADKVIMLENGEIIEIGTHSDLMAKGGKYADMFSKQAENYAERSGE